MKIENVYIKPDGQICACIVPVPPEPKRDRRHGQTTEFHFKIEYNKYRDALKACKDSSVRFEDQFSATILLHASLKIEPPRKAVNEELKEHVKNDTFYPLQCYIQIVEQKRYRMSYQKNDWTDWTCEVPGWAIPSIEYETRKVARLIPEAKGHGFCEKPGHVCTMNYCDENGCQERKRVLLPEAPAPSDFKTARKFERFTAKDKESIAPIVEESQLIIVTRKLQKNLEDYKRMRDGWKEGTHQYEAYALMVREYRKIIDMLLPIAITRKP